MATDRNSTDQTDTDDLRRSFMLALNDSLKTEKVAAGTLEVVRKYLADVDAERRWQVEQAALVAGGSTVDPKATEGATSGATAPVTPRIVAGVNLHQLPFPVNRKGVEVPVKASEADDSSNAKPTTTWEGLNQVPFLTPDH